MSKRILITDKVHHILIDGLKQLGFDVNYQPVMSYLKVQKEINKYDGLIINSKVICDKKFLDNANHLDFIGRLGSGLDIVDQKYATATGINIISSPEGNANAVGEHVLGMILGLLHNIGTSHNEFNAIRWHREAHRGDELKNKIVGIIGFGHTGPAFAKKLVGFGSRILVYDKYRPEHEIEMDNIEPVALKKLLELSDIVSLHIPLTKETLGWVDQSFFMNMKRGSVIINTSRGTILNSADLVTALDTGQISGACLDVLENENPDSCSTEEHRTYNALLAHKKVIITPHIAGWTFQSLYLIATILLDKIRNFYQV